jgi:hypothetical protein
MPARIRVAGQEHERCTTKHGASDSMGFSAEKPDLGSENTSYLGCSVTCGLET